VFSRLYFIRGDATLKYFHSLSLSAVLLLKESSASLSFALGAKLVIVKIKSRAAGGLVRYVTHKKVDAHVFLDKYATVSLLIATPRVRKKTALWTHILVQSRASARTHLAKNASMCEQRRESWQILYSVRLCVYM
jgi:hypothetical protein